MRSQLYTKTPFYLTLSAKTFGHHLPNWVKKYKVSLKYIRVIISKTCHEAFSLHFIFHKSDSVCAWTEVAWKWWRQQILHRNWKEGERNFCALSPLVFGQPFLMKIGGKIIKQRCDFFFKFNWFEAWSDCARKNMSLIAIDTLAKHEQIDHLLKRLYSKWQNCTQTF